MSARRPDERPLIAVMYLGSNGGGPKFAFELAKGLRSVGYRTMPIVSDHVDNRSDFDRLGTVLALPTFTTAMGALLRSPLILVDALRIRRQIRRRRVSALVIAMEHVWQAPILALLRGCAVPQLLCVHDASMHPGDDNRLETTLLALQRRIADGALTFSEHVAGRLLDDGVFSEDRIWRTVHGAFGAPTAEPHRAVRAGQVPTVGFFGRIAEYKGIGLCYDAVRALRASGHAVRFRVVGDGPRHLVEHMTHADDDIRVGWVDDHEIPEILQGFSVLALPYTESSQSGVFAYAISQGLPIVATPVGGLLEQAEDTGAAAVADAVAPEDYARALEEVLTDAELYERLAANGLVAASGAHSWARVAADADAALTDLGAQLRG